MAYKMRTTAEKGNTKLPFKIIWNMDKLFSWAEEKGIVHVHAVLTSTELFSEEYLDSVMRSLVEHYDSLQNKK